VRAAVHRAERKLPNRGASSSARAGGIRSYLSRSAPPNKMLQCSASPDVRLLRLLARCDPASAGHPPPAPGRVVVSFPTNDRLTLTPAIFLRGDLTAARADLDGICVGLWAWSAISPSPFAAAPASSQLGRCATYRISFEKRMGIARAQSETPAIARSLSLHRAFLTRFAPRNGWPTQCAPAPPGPPDDAMADYQRIRDEHFHADLQSDLRHGGSRSPAARDARPVSGAAQQPGRAESLFRHIGRHCVGPRLLRAGESAAEHRGCRAEGLRAAPSQSNYLRLRGVEVIGFWSITLGFCLTGRSRI
jgi:hypothetical protein